MTTLTLITNTGVRCAPLHPTSEVDGIARAQQCADRLDCTAHVRVNGKLVYVAAPRLRAAT